MKLRPARLLFPAVRWDAERGFEDDAPLIEAALRRGAGGFSIFGGTTTAVAELTWQTQSRSDVPLLFGSDLERGAGQQFAGAASLPPLAAIGSLHDPALTRRAGELTARGAGAVGVNWLFAPVADVDLEPRNPIVGTRSFATDPAVVARHVTSWIEGARAGRVLTCAKHYPGHGRTVEDSHAALPHVRAGAGELQLDLEPFRAAIRAGVDSIMTAHVVYTALDAGAPATLSAPILQGLLRNDLGFEGLVVTDALNMAGVLQAAGGEEARAAIAAVNAGCDAILYPDDFAAVADACAAALRSSLRESRVAVAIERIEEAALRCPPQWDSHDATNDQRWALEVATRAVLRVRGLPRCPAAYDLLTIDDDLGGPFAPPTRVALPAALQEYGIPGESVTRASAARPLVIALYADIRAWKGTPGISERALQQLRAALHARGDATVLLFGHPRLAEVIPGETVVAAWGGEPLMQRAAAAWLRDHAARTVL